LNFTEIVLKLKALFQFISITMLNSSKARKKSQSSQGRFRRKYSRGEVAVIPRKSKNKKTGEVSSIQLYLRFPANVSKALWGINQKEFSLELEENEGNWNLADEIRDYVADDLRLFFKDKKETFDTTLASYLPVNWKNRGRYKTLKIDIPDLSKVVETYMDMVIWGRSKQTACAKKYHQSLKSDIAKLPQDLFEPEAIQNGILKLTSARMVNRLPNLISDAIDWAKDIGMLDQKLIGDTPNPYKLWSSKKMNRRKEPKKVSPVMIDLGYAKNANELPQNREDIRAFTPEEAMHIMEAFKHRADGVFYPFVVAKFLTGARPGELKALQWQDINDDCSVIHFAHAWDDGHKRRVSTKNEKERYFTAPKELQELLFSLRSSDYKQRLDEHIFKSKTGKPILLESFDRIWRVARARGKYTLGVIPELVAQGLVREYLDPYHSRHTLLRYK
jgi:integrase